MIEEFIQAFELMDYDDRGSLVDYMNEYDKRYTTDEDRESIIQGIRAILKQEPITVTRIIAITNPEYGANG